MILAAIFVNIHWIENQFCSKIHKFLLIAFTNVTIPVAFYILLIQICIFNYFIIYYSLFFFLFIIIFWIFCLQIKYMLLQFCPVVQSLLIDLYNFLGLKWRLWSKKIVCFFLFHFLENGTSVNIKVLKILTTKLIINFFFLFFFLELISVPK